MREGSEREDLVLCQALGNFPQMHILFFSYKAMTDCHEIVKGLWLPSEKSTLIYVTHGWKSAIAMDLSVSSW